MTQLQAMKTGFIAIILIFLAFFAYMYTQVTVLKTVEITEEQVLEEDGQYYLLLDSRKLKIRVESLQHLQLEKYTDYNVTYSFNKMNADKGRVEDLEAYGANFPWAFHSFTNIKIGWFKRVDFGSSTRLMENNTNEK